MKIVNSLKEYKDLLNEYSSKSVGFVPTMGALHSGHLSLINKSKKDNDITVCSIFINEIQFNNKEDYIKYPKTEDKDIELLENVKCDILFYPNKSEIYTNDFNNIKIDMSILNGLDNKMEGKFRHGHFEGVIKIVEYFLLNLKPNKAYFGEKDFQQYKIIDSYVKYKNISTEIIPCNIFREDNGLAMSSRNIRLSNEKKEKSAVIYKTLSEIKENYNKYSLSEILDNATNNFNIEGFELEYIEIVDKNTLESISEKSDKDVMAFIAVFVDGVRLIDNIKIN